MYQPKMEIVKARKLGVRSKIYLFSKMVQGYGNGSADIWLVMKAAGQAGHYFYVYPKISMGWTQSESNAEPHSS